MADGTEVPAEAAVHSMLMLISELDRVHGPGYTKASVEEHKPAIDAALETISKRSILARSHNGASNYHLMQMTHQR